MTDRPLIGVPTQTLQVIEAIPTHLPESWVMNQRYLQAIAGLGGVPVLVPLFGDRVDTLRQLYDRLDGLFLAGGVDIDPERYGEAKGPHIGPTDAARDRVELQLTRWALEDRKPLLGVCRGVQILNVAAGGTLYQDVERELPGAIKHDYFPTAGFSRDHLAHTVRLIDPSRLRELFALEEVMVNSMHHQGIKTLASGLRPAAVAPDGLVEAAEVEGDAFQVAVVWHAEMFTETHSPTRRLFQAFLQAAADYRGDRLFAGDRVG